MELKNIIMMLIFVVSIMLVYEMTRINTLNKCPKPVIEYRYMPRTFKEEQDEPVPMDDIFKTMFSNISPWMMSRGIGLTDRRVI